MALLKYVSQTGRGMAWFEMACCEMLGERLGVCYNGFAQIRESNGSGDGVV
jgi:hypothetical protein